MSSSNEYCDLCQKEHEGAVKAVTTVAHLPSALRRIAGVADTPKAHVIRRAADALERALLDLQRLPVETSPSPALMEVSRLRGIASTCLGFKPTSGNMRYALEQIAGLSEKANDDLETTHERVGVHTNGDPL